MRLKVALALVGLLAAATWWTKGGPGTQAQGRTPAGTSHTGEAFRFNKVREGIYHAVGTGSLAVVGNGAVIVADDGVTIVDDHVSPAAAWVLLEEVKRLTPKPIKRVINTHFHFDHAHGNQVFGAGVDIIGHEFTRQMLLGGQSLKMPLYAGYLAGLPGSIETLRGRLAKETDPKTRATLQTQLSSAENNLASQKELAPVPPNVTLTQSMSLHSGGRGIEIRYLGRGHTAGDVVVFLPQDRVVITGDFLTAALSNLSDSFPDEWVASLDALKKLPFDTVLPGHGEAFTDRAKIDYFQAYLRDVWTEVSRLKKEGVSVEEAAKRADLTRHRDRIPSIQGPGVPVLGVQRIYDLIDGKVAR